MEFHRAHALVLCLLFESLAAGKQTVLNAIKTHAVVMGSRPKLEQMISDEVTEQPCFL